MSGKGAAALVATFDGRLAKIKAKGLHTVV